MSGLWEIVSNTAGAIVITSCKVVAAAAQHVAEAVQRCQPAGDRPEAMEATGVQDRVIAQVAEWLSAPARSAFRNEALIKLLPVFLTAIEESGLRGFIGERVRVQLEGVDLAPAAAGLLSLAIEKGHHQRLLDELSDALEKLLGSEEAMEDLRRRVRGQLPAIFDLYRGEPFVMRRVVAAATTLIVEVRNDPAHPLRVQLDQYATTLTERLRTSSELASRADRLKHELLARPEFSALGEEAWNVLREFLVGDALSERSEVRHHLEAMQVDGRGGTDLGRRAPRSKTIPGPRSAGSRDVNRSLRGQRPRSRP